MRPAETPPPAGHAQRLMQPVRLRGEKAQLDNLKTVVVSYNESYLHRARGSRMMTPRSNAGE